MKLEERKMRALTITFLIAAVAMILSSCAVTDVDRQFNVNRYHSFTWGESEIKTENPLYRGDLIDKNIKHTISEEFAKRGITYDPKHADFVVSYHTYTEQKQQAYANNSFYGGFFPFYGWGYYYSPFGYRPFGPYGYNNSYRNNTYTEGTLIVDIRDGKTRETVWRGSVSGNVDNTKKLERQVRKGIQAIMKKYPVPADNQLRLPEGRPAI